MRVWYAFGKWRIVSCLGSDVRNTLHNILSFKYYNCTDVCSCLEQYSPYILSVYSVISVTWSNQRIASTILEGRSWSSAVFSLRNGRANLSFKLTSRPRPTENELFLTFIYDIAVVRRPCPRLSPWSDCRLSDSEAFLHFSQLRAISTSRSQRNNIDWLPINFSPSLPNDAISNVKDRFFFDRKNQVQGKQELKVYWIASFFRDFVCLYK